MARLQTLFNFDGRTSRLGYWRTQIALLLAMALFWCGGLLLAEITGVGILSSVALIGCAVVYLPVIALIFRRLHDRNKSAWWIVPFQVAPFALGLMSESSKNGHALAGVLALAELALFIWGFVEIGVLRGTRGPNRFGPEPQGA